MLRQKILLAMVNWAFDVGVEPPATAGHEGKRQLALRIFQTTDATLNTVYSTYTVKNPSDLVDDSAHVGQGPINNRTKTILDAWAALIA